MSQPPPTTMSTTAARDQTINLGAGPSTLPTPILLEASQGILDYEGTGMGVTELSHRSSTFQDLLKEAESNLRTLLDIPDTHAVVFLQGGGTEQFSATLLNMLAAHAARNPSYQGTPPVDYVVSGAWSDKAIKEAQRITPRVNLAADLRPAISNKDTEVTPPERWALSALDDAPAMLYYCDNETIDGFEFPQDFVLRLPQAYRERVPIVADCSSNILSRRLDVSAHAVVYFGAQKNIGPSGVTIAVIRRDLVVDPDAVRRPYTPIIPTTLVYKNAVDNGSLYNTPPMFPIYVSALVFRRLLQHGGVDGAQERAATRSKAVYDALLAAPNLYRPVVQHPDFRSQMNITFRIMDPATRELSPDLEAQFVAACAERHILQVKGHRSVGGLRASFYNATSLEEAKAFVGVLQHFAKERL